MVIVDAGESTIDVSAYSRNTKEVKDSFEEIATPECEYTMVLTLRHFHLSFNLKAISTGRFSSASMPVSSSKVYTLL